MMLTHWLPLPRMNSPAMMRRTVKCAATVTLLLTSAYTLAQQTPAAKKDDLDVTMQIMVDPAAMRPDEVIRKIPLPAHKAATPAAEQTKSEPAKSSASATGQDGASDANQHGQDMADHAQERAQEAADQREQARRSAAEDHRKNPPKPPPPPGHH
jgi:hypothetical protein